MNLKMWKRIIRCSFISLGTYWKDLATNVPYLILMLLFKIIMFIAGLIIIVSHKNEFDKLVLELVGWTISAIVMFAIHICLYTVNLTKHAQGEPQEIYNRLLWAVFAIPNTIIRVIGFVYFIQILQSDQSKSLIYSDFLAFLYPFLIVTLTDICCIIFMFCYSIYSYIVDPFPEGVFRI